MTTVNGICITCSCTNEFSYDCPCLHRAIGIMHFHVKLTDYKKKAPKQELKIIDELLRVPRYGHKCWYHMEFYSSYLETQREVITNSPKFSNYLQTLPSGLSRERE